MYSKKLSPRQMLVWIASAMSAPLAIYAGKASWEWALATGIICVGAALLVLRFGSADYGRLLRIFQLVFLSLIAGVFSREISGCWGEDSTSMPLVMLALAALSAVNTAQNAGRVCCCVAWIAAIIYAIVMAVGIKNIQMVRLTEIGYHNEMVIVAYLLPAVWLLLPADRANALCLFGVILFAAMISLLCFGTLSVGGVLDAQIPFYQYSKSLTLLGIAERFEAAASVALTLGLFCTLSLLLSAAERMTKHGAVIAAAVAAVNVRINAINVAIMAVFAWIILPLITAVKKVKKR